MKPTDKRKRGGQPGSRNARMYDFYSQKLLVDRKQDFEQAVLIEGLDEESPLP